MFVVLSARTKLTASIKLDLPVKDGKHNSKAAKQSAMHLVQKSASYWWEYHIDNGSKITHNQYDLLCHYYTYTLHNLLLLIGLIVRTGILTVRPIPTPILLIVWYFQFLQVFGGNPDDTPCLKKTVQTYFLSELCQISTDCKNFWHQDSRENRLFWGVLIFHLT